MTMRDNLRDEHGIANEMKMFDNHVMKIYFIDFSYFLRAAAAALSRHVCGNVVDVWKLWNQLLEREIRLGSHFLYLKKVIESLKFSVKVSKMMMKWVLMKSNREGGWKVKSFLLFYGFFAHQHHLHLRSRAKERENWNLSTAVICSI